MAYAAGAAHYHRLPTLRAVVKPLIRRIIHKMMRREVWEYWFNTSLSGNRTNPDLKELREPWADPVVRENIMYSGHLLLMISLYTMLFDDDEFDKPQSLSFHWNPIFWGIGPEIFHYDRLSLQAAILAEMERTNWIGVCCEPNMVFVVCNQFPMIAMRYNNVRDNTNVAGDVKHKCKAAWDKKNMIAPNGLYFDAWLVKQDKLVRPKEIGFTAWANAFMNSWNADMVKSVYEKQARGFITVIDGAVHLHDSATANAYRQLIDTEQAYPHDAAVLEKARSIGKILPPSPFPYARPTFGYVAQWLFELGKTIELDGLLDFADAKLRPTWEKGGLLYPRDDQRLDDAGEWANMDPFSGNAAIRYARLSV